MTQAIFDIQKQVRRALQGALYSAVVTAAKPLLPDGTPAIQWDSAPFNRVGLDSYFAVQLAFAAVNVLEVGPNPMMQGAGHLTINARTPLDKGQDDNDALAGIIGTAYPYASTPSWGGVSVFIDRVTPGSYGSDGTYMTRLVTVEWNIYRRP